MTAELLGELHRPGHGPAGRPGAGRAAGGRRKR